MRITRTLGFVFVALATLCLVVGGAATWMSSEAADNECREGDCTGRDQRAENFGVMGMAFLIGGFCTLAFGALLVAVPALRAPRTT